MDKGADVELGSAYLTLEDNETTVVEGHQAADAQGGLSLLALDGRGVGAVQVLTDGLEVVTEALEAQEIGNLVGDGRLLSVALQGILGGGPEQMGVGIIGECLEAAVVVSVGKRLGDVQTKRKMSGMFSCRPVDCPFMLYSMICPSASPERNTVCVCGT